MLRATPFAGNRTPLAARPAARAAPVVRVVKAEAPAAAPAVFTPPVLDPNTPSPIFGGSTGGLLRKAQVSVSCEGASSDPQPWRALQPPPPPPWRCASARAAMLGTLWAGVSAPGLRHAAGLPCGRAVAVPRRGRVATASRCSAVWLAYLASGLANGPLHAARSPRPPGPPTPGCGERLAERGPARAAAHWRRALSGRVLTSLRPGPG